MNGNLFPSISFQLGGSAVSHFPTSAWPGEVAGLVAVDTVSAGGLKRVLHFDIVRSLSQGGMADLFLARARGMVGTHRLVVIKRLRLKYAHDAEFAAMFLDEARIALSLEHANIVRTYEVGTWNGALCIALEYLRGSDLGQLMASAPSLEQHLTLEAALTVASSLAAGLHHAHTRSSEDGSPLHIVHRDVSPGNVFICDDGQVKLLDFGVASYSERVSRRTPRGVIKGKFPYMSPEQCLNDEVDARSDLFSLGVLLYELTTGRRPFRGLRAVDIVQKVIDAPIDPPSRVRPGYPPVLQRLVLRALSKRAEERHASAEEFESELEDVARQLGLVLAPGPVARFIQGALGRGLRTDARAAWTAPPADAMLPGGDTADTVTLFPTPVPAGRHTVLVVDAEEAVHIIIKPLLTGYQRISAYTAAQALDALATNRVDVVLLDLDLPDHSGYHVLDQIRQTGTDVAVIVCTAQSDVSSAVESMRRGAFDFLVKSRETYEDLPRHIHRALTRRRLAPRGPEASRPDRATRSRPMPFG
jgi:serine/threonine protein kinase/ActR/RegA family two-component response regulator